MYKKMTTRILGSTGMYPNIKKTPLSIRPKIFLIFGVLVLALSIAALENFVLAASPGDVIINEFSSASNPEWVELLNTTDSDISLSGFKLSELTTPQGEIPTEILLLNLSGTIPAHGILVFDIPGSGLDPKLNDPGDSIALYNGEIDPANLWQRVTYGTVTGYPITAGLETEPQGGESAVFADSSWSVSTSPTKGWFNGSPTIAELVASINAAGVTTNFGELDNPSATPEGANEGLYFEMIDFGRVTFTITLNLTDPDTATFLQNLGRKMEADSGSMKFDARTAQDLKDAGAEIKLYGLDELGFTSTPNLIVKDDEGIVINPGDVGYPDISVLDYTDGTLTFTTNHFTQFEVDDNVYVNASTGSNDNSGSEASPVETIQYGIAIVPDNGTVNVAAGEYEIEGIVVDKKNISIIGPGIGGDVDERAYVVVVEDDCASSPGAAFHLHANGITLQGLDIDGACEHVVHIGDLSEIQVNGVTVSGNAIHGGSNGATLSWGSSNASTSPNVVSENKIYGNDVGVLIESAFDNIIEKNDIFENNYRGIELSLCDGCGLGSPSGNIIRENTITRNEGHGIYSGRDEVVIGDLDILDNTISRNNGGSGIYLNRVGESPDTLNISGNIINANDSYGIYTGEIDGNSVVINENIITNNSSAGIYLSGDSGGISNSDVSLEDNTIRNNSREGVYINRVDNESTLDVINNTITENGSDEDVEGNDYAGVYINNVFGGSTVTFRDNTISDNDSRGVYICAEGQCSSSILTFRGNTIENNNSAGLYVYDLRSSTLDVLENTVRGTTGPGFELVYVGESGGIPPTPSTVTVSENVFDGNYYGIYINETDGNSTVTIGENNTIENNSNTGIFLGSPVSGVTITGNILQNNGAEGGDTGIVVLSASGNEAHNNTITGNGSLGVSNQEDGEVVFDFDATNNFWGGALGPFHETGNPDGAGNNGVSDNVDFDPWYTNAARTTLSDGVFTDASYGSPVDGQADLPPGATEVELNNDTILDLSAGLVDNAVILQSGVEGEPIVLTNADLDDVTVSIPDGTSISGPDGWDGIIQPPTAGTPSGSAPAGFSVGDTVISVGSTDGTLVFDVPVTIVLEGVTGAVGYRPAGSETWVQITNVCGGAYADPEDPVSPGECYITNGTDTKIVTFHFTAFGSLNPVSSPAPAPAPSGGGGGGGWTPPSPTEPVGGFKFSITPDVTQEGIVTLNFDGGSDAKTIAIANNPDFAPASYINYTTSTAWNLSGPPGEKTLYVKFSNQYAQYSKVLSDTVLYTLPVSTDTEQVSTAIAAVQPQSPQGGSTQSEPAVLGEETATVPEPAISSKPAESQSLLAVVGSAVTLGTNSAIVGILSVLFFGFVVYGIYVALRRRNL